MSVNPFSPPSPPAPCYVRGTLLLTDRGQVPIEALEIGDTLVTLDGSKRPVRWLGSRAIDCWRYREPATVWPIHIVAGAFGDGLPMRDLWVSPGHSVYVDGVLLRAGQLVNGATVTREPLERVEYWHVELETHDIVFAEGLTAETYLDTGNRTAFIQGPAHREAFPDFEPKHWAQTCAPLVTEGEALEQARKFLVTRAVALGLLVTDPDLHVLADGKRIDPIVLAEGRFAFVLPETRPQLELCSRRFVPAELDPGNGDTRALGANVARLQVDGVDLPLEDPRVFANGWHELERNPGGRSWRWSMPNARLPVRARLVVIDLACRGYYRVEARHNVVSIVA